VSAVLKAREPNARYLAALQPPLVEHFELVASAPGGLARLRELILTLAVSGSLMPQDRNDEPASVLLEQIHTEKSRLIAEGKTHRAKQHPEIRAHEIPFNLPPGWVWVRLGTLLQKIGSGSTPLGGKEVYVPSGIKFLRSQNVWNDGLRLDGVVFITPQMHAQMAGTVVRANDLLFNITGASIGRCAVVPADFDEANVSQHVTIVRPVLTALNAYLHKVLISRRVQQSVRDVQVGVSREGLSVAKLSDFLIPLPPLAEQVRIVGRVDELMHLCDALEAKGRLEDGHHPQMLNTLLGTLTDKASPEELAANWQRVAAHVDLLLDRPEAVDALEQRVCELAVRGLLVPQDRNEEPASLLLARIGPADAQFPSNTRARREKTFPDIARTALPFDAPAGWAWSRFGRVAEIDSDLVLPAAFQTAWQVAPDCIEKKTGRLLHRRTVAAAEVTSPNHRFSPGQILYSKIRPSLSKVTLVDFAGLCSADMYPINAKVNSDFLLLYMLSQTFLEQVFVAENRVKMPKLNQEALTAFLVPVPPLAEQARIVSRVTHLRRICAELRETLTNRQATQARLADALVDSAVSAADPCSGS
jgi:type I restriction enzyme, S subunit